MPLIPLLLANWRVIAIALLCGALFIEHERANHNHDDATKWQADYAAMAGALNKQNAAVDALRKEAEDSAKRHAVELAEAAKKRETAVTKAAVIMARPIPAGVNACDAASALFDEQINIH